MADGMYFSPQQSKISDAVAEEHPSAAGSQRPASPPHPILITQAPPTSRSPQPSQKPHTHISSSQPSQTPPSHNSRSPQPSQPAPTHPSPPPVLPRGVQRLLSDYSSLVGSQLCSDVIISTGDGRGIPAHSAILACRCPMLAEVYSPNCRTVYIQASCTVQYISIMYIVSAYFCYLTLVYAEAVSVL